MTLSVRTYMISIMKDQRNSFFDCFMKSVLLVVSWGYGIAVGIVDLAYKTGIRRKYKIGIPVVSVGNLTLGGTGKTPFAIFLADYFVSIKKKPAVLTRGYGQDESVMLKNEMPLVSVYVGRDRVLNARRAVSDGKDVVILDDGFSHRRIERDLNILMIDAVNFFGNKSMFPRGVLREPVSALERADIFVLTKVDSASESRIKEIRSFLGEKAQGKAIVETRHKPSFLTDVTGAAYAIECFKGKKIFVLSGIGDPDYLAFLLSATGAEIAGRYDFTDHYAYRQKDIDRIYRDSVVKKIEGIIITAKDYVKIKKLDLSQLEEKIFILNIIIDITGGKESLIAGLNSVTTG